MSVSIVTTTINKPILLAEYCKNISKNSYKDVNFIIIGDKKTPLDVSIFCDTLSKQSGYKILYYDIPQQLEYLKKFPDLAKHLPYNSIQRRNIGLFKSTLGAKDCRIFILFPLFNHEGMFAFRASFSLRFIP